MLMVTVSANELLEPVRRIGKGFHDGGAMRLPELVDGLEESPCLRDRIDH